MLIFSKINPLYSYGYMRPAIFIYMGMLINLSLPLFVNNY